ncbi:MAG: hypothetical protein ABSH08_07040 [Tepidisphaeraceae bacterium]|jgi:hypothetical protein
MSSETSPAKANAPVHAIRKHSLKASIWCNQTSAGVIYNVTLIRTYRDGENFKDTPSLGFDDLANAAKLLLDAESWITWKALRDKESAKDKPADVTSKTPTSDAGQAADAATPLRRRGRTPK